MVLKDLLSVVDVNSHLVLFVNGSENASVDAEYLNLCIRNGDPRGNYKVTQINPVVFSRWNGTYIPILQIYTIH